MHKGYTILHATALSSRVSLKISWYQPVEGLSGCARGYSKGASDVRGLMLHQAIANVPGEAKMDPDRWWRAGQYSDQVIKDTTGRGSFDFWYLCKGKNCMGELCWTVVLLVCGCG